MLVKDSNLWHYKLFVDIRRFFFLGELSSIRTGADEIDEFAVFPYIFISFRNKVDIIVHTLHYKFTHNNIPFWISADTNKDDLE